MAAAEYYNPGSLAPPPQHAVRLNAPPSNFQQSPPYPVLDGPPPPYSPVGGQARPHSQPPPQHRVHFGTQQGPSAGPTNSQQNFDTHQYPPEKLPNQPLNQSSNLQNMYRPSDFNPGYGPPPQLQPQQQPRPQPLNGAYPQTPNGGYPQTPNGGHPQTIGAMSQVYGAQAPSRHRRSSTPGAPRPPYNSDSRSRSRSRSRTRRQNHHERPRPQMPRKKSSGVNTFLGAGGGAIIGDLIFPGLGTLGGAILGGVGGHEYGKQRAEYTRDRTRSNPTRTRGRSHSNADRDYYHDDDYRR